MPTYITHGPDGRILTHGVFGVGSPVPDPGASIKEVPPQHIDIDQHYWDGSAIASKPPRPSQDHDFDYTDKTWKMNTTKAWSRVRRERDGLLQQTDWTVLKTGEQGSKLPKEWKDYRQALRDITLQPDPTNITWPVKPTTAP